MSYAVKIGTNEAIWIDNKPAPAGWVVFKGVMRDGLVWGDDIQNLREPNAQEIAAKEVAATAEESKRIESDTARSEAKQAYSELQPLIEHKDPAIALLAAIMQKHLLATLGR